MEYWKMDIWKANANEFNFLKEEVEKFTNRWMKSERD